SFIITQLFFQNAHYLDFMSKTRSLGIRVPILAGLMPVTNFAQVKRFSALCGATLPAALLDELAGVQDDAEAVARIGVRHAAQQGEELLHKAAPGIHFYTLNKSRATLEILEHLKRFRQFSASRL